MIPGDANQQDHAIFPGISGVYMGIDASLTSTGISLLGADAVTTWTWQPKDRGIERLSWLNEKINELIYDVKPDLVFLEDYAYSRGNFAHQIGEWGGCVRLALHYSGTAWYVAGPGQVKKFATGSGAAKKSQIILALYKRWGLEIVQEDEADATVLALMAMYSGESWQALPPGMKPLVPQMEVLRKIGSVPTAKDIRKRVRKIVTPGSQK